MYGCCKIHHPCKISLLRVSFNNLPASAWGVPRCRWSVAVNVRFGVSKNGATLTSHTDHANTCVFEILHTEFFLFFFCSQKIECITSKKYHRCSHNNCGVKLRAASLSELIPQSTSLRKNYPALFVVRRMMPMPCPNYPNFIALERIKKSKIYATKRKRHITVTWRYGQRRCFSECLGDSTYQR